MPTCKLCSKTFPFRMEIDGKVRNLKNRKYCIVCSPFGSHNRKQLENIRVKNGLLCVECNTELVGKQSKYCSRKCMLKKYKGRYQTKEYWMEKRHALKRKMVDIKGGKCVKCGYNKCLGALEFHHINPKDKEFRLSDAMRHSWDNTLNELGKCELLCSNCYKEAHWYKKGKV